MSLTVSCHLGGTIRATSRTADIVECLDQMKRIMGTFLGQLWTVMRRMERYRIAYGPVGTFTTTLSL